MSRIDQAKMALRIKKVQKELEREIIETETGNGAVRVEFNGEQKLKKIHIYPSLVDLDDITELERWLEDAIRDAIQKSQRLATEKMQPFMGLLGGLGL
ncbi:MAG: YbaB/EbfC family nucleoid-associated protein [Candidatus Saccharimonadales bacterium]